MQNLTAQTATANLPTTLRLGTRTSQLALWQTHHVVARLQAHWPQLHCELVHHVTQGDKRLDRPLPEIGGKGLFTAELEEALRRGEIDLAVHSLKDLPVEDAEGLIIGAILSREDTRDVLVAREPWTLATLPHGAVIGTSSLRRQAQLLAARPDLDVRSIRGNVDTRLRKVMSGEYDAAVMAGAGLSRLGLTAQIVEWLAPEVMLPAPGQGALAVQCRAGDDAVQTILAAIHDYAAATTTTAERQLLYRLGGGCSAPVGASAQLDGDQITLRARIASVDGRNVFDATAVGHDAFEIAVTVAEQLLQQGAQVALSRSVRTPGLPLAGKRIVVTRPQHDDTQGDDLAAMLRQQGATALEIPAIALVAEPDLGALDAAVSISNNVYWPHSFRRDSNVKPLPVERSESRYYLRIGVADEPGVLARVAGKLAEHKISIASVIQKEVDGAGTAELVIMTHEARESGLQAALQGVRRLNGVEDVQQALRVMT